MQHFNFPYQAVFYEILLLSMLQCTTLVPVAMPGFC